MKKKLFVTTIVIAMAISMLIGCGKSENNDSLQNSKGNEEINSEMLPAEGGSVNEDIDSGEGDIEIGKDTVEVTFEEYLNIVLRNYDGYFDVADTIPDSSTITPSELGLAIFIKDEKDAELTFSRVYVLYNNGPIEGTVPVISANGLDMLECNIDFSEYGFDSSIDMTYFVGFNHEMTKNEVGSYDLIPMSEYDVPARVNLLDEWGIQEAIYNNLYFEYDSSLNSLVMKTSDGNVFAYFGEYSIVEVDDFCFATYTTKLAEGDFVVYIPMGAYSRGRNFYPYTTSTEKEYVFVTHH